PSALYQFRKLVARHKVPFAFLATVFVLLLGFAITMAAQSARIARERDKAVAAERVAEKQRELAVVAQNAEHEEHIVAKNARDAEQEQRLIAEANLRRAEAQRMRAEDQERANYRLLYAANMNLAGQAWERSNFTRLRELLNSYLPQSGRED